MAPGAGPSAPPGGASAPPATPTAGGGGRVDPGVVLPVAACAALAALSLLAHATPGFDPWAWLVWGRQLAQLELDTGTGLSWKPLPVLFTTPLSSFGDAAPALWLLVARTGGLLAVVATARLARRYAGRLAGAVAAAALLLTPGTDARFLRLLAQGNVEPLVVAACLWAVDRHLAGRPRQALLLAVVGGLARPEVWPFALLYGLWLWRRAPAHRVGTLAVLAAIPVLWFGGDLLGSGDALTGAQAASVVANDVGHRLTLALARIGGMVMLPVWGAALVGVLVSHRCRWLAPQLLAAAALSWAAMVLLMTVVFGYAALGRFLAPAAALLCVLAGIGAAVVVRRFRTPAGRAVAGLVLLAVTVPFAMPRVVAGLDQVGFAAQREDLAHDLDVVVSRAGGAAAMRGHGAIAVEIDTATLSAWPALAWRVGVPLGDIVADHRGVDAGVVVAQRDGAWERSLTASDEARAVRVLARSEHWVVLTVVRG